MKVKIPIAEKQRWLYAPLGEMYNDRVDDILIWAMERDMQAEFYAWAMDDGHYYAVMQIEPKDLVMFALRWGAGYSKPQPARF